MHQRLVTNIENCNLLYISSTTIDDSFKTNFHSHPNLEILLVTKGEGFILTTNRKIPVKKGTLVIINPNCKHYEASNGLSFYAIGIDRTNIYLNDSFEKKIIYFELIDSEFKAFNRLYDIIYDEAFNKKDKYQEVVDSLINAMLAMIERKNLTINNSMSNNESDIVHNIKSIIDTYYYQDIKLDDIAHRLSGSKSNICHAFKKETGQSIIEYKISRQLEEANNLLKISDMSISEIASLVGFNDVSYFIKYFKKKYNMTPKEFKDNMKKK